MSFFADPVTAEDSIEYEREAITKWIVKNGTSPHERGKELTIGGLRPSIRVREEASKWASDQMIFYQPNADATVPTLPFGVGDKVVFNAQTARGIPPVPLTVRSLEGSERYNYVYQLGEAEEKEYDVGRPVKHSKLANNKARNARMDICRAATALTKALIPPDSKKQAREREEFQVTVVDVKQKSHVIDVHSDDTIGMLKRTIHDKVGAKKKDQRLQWGGKRLNDDQKLMDICTGDGQYMIYEKCLPPSITLLFNLKGGRFV